MIQYFDFIIQYFEFMNDYFDFMNEYFDFVNENFDFMNEYSNLMNQYLTVINTLFMNNYLYLWTYLIFLMKKKISFINIYLCFMHIYDLFYDHIFDLSNSYFISMNKFSFLRTIIKFYEHLFCFL